ncbi:MAG: hypothetical protein ABW092_09965 [Candidatus Thiodiazotropha sp.]
MKGSVGIFLSAIPLLPAIQGCGGGGGSSDDPVDTNNPTSDDSVTDNSSDVYIGSESETVVNDSNAKDLAISAASAVKQRVDEHAIVLPAQTAVKAYDQAPLIAPLGTIDSSTKLYPHGGSAIVEFNEATGQVN